MARAEETIPIIIGVGDVQNRSLAPEDAIEPMQLMLQAIDKASKDTGIDGSQRRKLQENIDSIDVVQTWTWPYEDLPGLIAAKIGVSPRHKSCSGFGGNEVARMVDEAARRILHRKSRIAVVTGGEALASRMSIINQLLRDACL